MTEDFERIRRHLTILDEIVDRLFGSRSCLFKPLELIEKKLNQMECLVAQLSDSSGAARDLFGKWKDRLSRMWEKFAAISTPPPSRVAASGTGGGPVLSGGGSGGLTSSLASGPVTGGQPVVAGASTRSSGEPSRGIHRERERSRSRSRSPPPPSRRQRSSRRPSVHRSPSRSPSWSRSPSPRTRRANRWAKHSARLKRSFDELSAVSSETDLRRLKKLYKKVTKAFDLLVEHCVIGDHEVHGSFLKLATEKLPPPLVKAFARKGKHSLKALTVFLHNVIVSLEHGNLNLVNTGVNNATGDGRTDKGSSKSSKSQPLIIPKPPPPPQLLKPKIEDTTDEQETSPSSVSHPQPVLVPNVDIQPKIEPASASEISIDIEDGELIDASSQSASPNAAKSNPPPITDASRSSSPNLVIDEEKVIGDQNEDNLKKLLLCQFLRNCRNGNSTAASNNGEDDDAQG